MVRIIKIIFHFSHYIESNQALDDYAKNLLEKINQDITQEGK